jgi:hypothetical protein
MAMSTLNDLNLDVEANNIDFATATSDIKFLMQS